MVATFTASTVWARALMGTPEKRPGNLGDSKDCDLKQEMVVHPTTARTETPGKYRCCVMLRGNIGITGWMLALAIVLVSACGGGSGENGSGENRLPVASFTREPVYDVPFRFRFSAADSRDPDGNIVRYEWSIRSLSQGLLLEEVTATSAEVTHTFRESGHYVQSHGAEYGLENNTVQVELVVTDDDGATAEHSREFALPGGLTFAGQEGLIDRVEAAGGPFGSLALIDTTCRAPFEEATHAHWSRRLLRKEGVPDENIWFSNPCTAEQLATNDIDELAIDDRYASTDARNGLLVVALEITTPFGGPFDAHYVRQMNTVWVMGSHNIGQQKECEYNALVFDRNFWSPHHSWWGLCLNADPDSHRVAGFLAIDTYYNTLASVATGKVVVSVAVEVENNGDIVPFSPVASCGALKEYCFAVPWATSASASIAMLSGLMYLFMQMYDDASEAVEALKRCTIDIGEPGVDPEFGQGLVDLRSCPEARLPIIER